MIEKCQPEHNDKNSTIITQAIQLHTAGKILEAKQLYQQILATDPCNAKALHFLGVAYLQLAEHKQGADYIEQSLKIKPDDAEVHNNLGIAFMSLGCDQEAIASYKRALAIKPDYAEVYSNLGVALANINRHEEAIIAIEQSLKIKPDDAEAYNNLGLALANTSHYEEAINAYSKCLAIKPNYSDVHNNLGITLKALKRDNEAMAHYEQALVLNPNNFNAHNNLGALFTEQKRPLEAIAHHQQALIINPDSVSAYIHLGNAQKALNHNLEAIASYKRALAIKPDYAEVYSNLGVALVNINNYEEAITSYKQALAIKPDCAEVYSNLGVALANINRHEEAIIAYDKCLAINQNYIDASWNKGMALLTLGDYQTGWQLHEKRLQNSNFPPLPTLNLPRWIGEEDLKGKNLLVQQEQGLGDAIQMIRYIRLLAALQIKCWVQTPRELQNLFQISLSNIHIVAADEVPIGMDYRIPVMSLPLACKSFTEDSIPRNIPYLMADSQKIAKWQANLLPYKKKVGLSWRGSTANPNDHNRSVALATFLPLINHQNLTFIVLQQNVTSEESATLRQYTNVIAIDGDLDEKAAIISLLDVMISVDSALAHLAGALGKNTWILLPFSADWRWLRQRNDSSWYPTARLFRQPSIGDWQSVIAEVGNELKKI